MECRRSKRSLRSTKSTAKYQARFLGIWVVVTLLMLGGLSALVYVQYCSMWNQASTGIEPFTQESFARGQMLAGLIVASCLCAGAIFALAILTAHRIGGPFLWRSRTFEEVKHGNLDTRLHFREYDGLDEVEVKFNEMMQGLQSRIEELEAKETVSGQRIA